MQPATREAPATEPGAGGRGRRGAEGNPPTPLVDPGRVDFGGIDGSNGSSSSDDSRTSSNSSNSNDRGNLPTLVGGPARDLEIFRRDPRSAKRTHDVLVAGLDHEGVLRKCPVGVYFEGRESQEDHGGGGRGSRTSSRFTAGRVSGEGT